MRCRTLKLLVVITGFAVMVAGCAITQETKQSLIAYTTAMEQVQIATDQFLVDFASVEELRKQLERSLAGDEALAEDYPATYTPRHRLKASVAGVEADIQARINALSAVATYNDALVALVEGRSESEISARLTSFGTGIGSILQNFGIAASPRVGAVIPLASKLAKLVQDGLNREEFKEALKLGQPLVEAVLAQLERDTTQYYEASVTMTDRKRDEPKVEIRIAVASVNELTGRHSSPSETNLQNEVRQIQRRLLSIGTRTGTRTAMHDSLLFVNGKPPYNQQAHGQMQVLMQAVDAAAKKDAELVAKQNAYYDLMDAYVATLRQTKSSLANVQASLDRPVNIDAEARRLLGVALGLRDALNDYKAAR